MEIKNKVVRFRVTEKERNTIKNISTQLGYDSVSDYLYSISLTLVTKKQRADMFSELHEFRSGNARVENNINQIAKYLNTTKNLDQSKLDDYIVLFSEFISIRLEQNTILNKLIDRLNDR